MRILVYPIPWVRGPYGAVRGQVQPQVILHLGDCVPGRSAAGGAVSDIPLLGVPGSCDYGGLDQPEQLTELGGVRILMMHGHTRHVKSGPMAAMCTAARECGADILLFGHTHQPLVGRARRLQTAAEPPLKQKKSLAAKMICSR